MEDEGKLEIVQVTKPITTDPGGKLETQIVSAVDGFGAPVLFASLFVYVVMLIAVKPFLEGWAADKGKTKAQRSRLNLTATVVPGLLAACLVDFGPIARAFGVELHWIATIPAGAVFYAGGGILTHQIVKRIDPIGRIEAAIPWIGKPRGKIDEELEARYTEATTRGQRAITPEDVESDKKKRGL